MWLICQTTFRRGKTKLLIRGIHGAEWVFCPMVRSIKKDRVSVQGCRGCQHFIRFEQMCVAKTPLAGKAFHSKKLIHGFRFAKPLGGWKAKSSSTGLLHQMPGFIRERQPLIDVFEEEDHVLVLAELPGVDKKDVHIKADENTITITAENPTTKYLKMIRLPTQIKRGKAQVTYRNNILQVKLKKIY